MKYCKQFLKPVKVIPELSLYPVGIAGSWALFCIEDDLARHERQETEI